MKDIIYDELYENYFKFYEIKKNAFNVYNYEYSYEISLINLITLLKSFNNKDILNFYKKINIRQKKFEVSYGGMLYKIDKYYDNSLNIYFDRFLSIGSNNLNFYNHINFCSKKSRCFIDVFELETEKYYMLLNENCFLIYGNYLNDINVNNKIKLLTKI